MPELPEVETVRRQLAHVLIHKTIAHVHVFKLKSWTGDVKLVEGQKITEIGRRSKMLQMKLSNGQSILVHLKMSGQLIYIDGEKRVGGGHPSPDWIHDLPSSHTRVQLDFIDGTHLFFNDQRIFGWLRVMDEQAVQREFSKVAPDIIDPEITTTYLYEKYQRRAVPVKVMLMDNTIAAGVGNIYACDALNLARILPSRPAKSLSRSEVERVLKSARKVIELGIKNGGATIDDKYVDVKGLAGHYQDFARVYGKKGKPCPNCDAPIQKTTIAGRGTYFCSVCQK